MTFTGNRSGNKIFQSKMINIKLYNMKKIICARCWSRTNEVNVRKKLSE